MRVLSKRLTFFVVTLSFICGTFIENILVSSLQSYTLWGLFLILMVQVCFYKWHFSYFFVLIFTIFYAFGVINTQFTYDQIEANKTFLEPYFLDSKVALQYTVQEVYKQDDFSRDYLVLVDQINEQVVSIKNILAVIRVPRNYTFWVWDILVSSVKLVSIHNFSQSDFVSYSLSKDIYFRAYPYVFDKKWSELPLPLASSLHTFRTTLSQQIDMLYPQDTWSLLWGILIGVRSSIRPELRDNFNRSWLTHIVAVSGFNITILLLFSYVLFFLFPKPIQLIGTMTLGILFVLLVWPSMSVLRAAIMGLVGYFVIFLWRKVDSLSILLLSLSTIVFFSPMSLNYDISLQLSFLATAGILLFSEPLKKVLFFVPKWFLIQDTLVMTFAAMILNIPIIVSNFGQISLVAPLTNLLVVWNIPFIMFFWFLSILLAPFFHLWALVFSYFTYLFLRFDIEVVNFFWKQQWSVLLLDIGQWKWYLIGGYYVTVLIFYWRR